MRGRGDLYRWNDSTNVWTKVAEFADNSSNAVVHPDGMHIDSSGRRAVA